MLTKGLHTLHCFYVYVHKGPTYFTLFLRVCSQRAHILYIVSWCMFTKGPHTLHCFYVYVHKGPTLLGSNFICPWPCQVRYLLPASMTAGRRWFRRRWQCLWRCRGQSREEQSRACNTFPCPELLVYMCTKTRVKDYYCGWGKCYR